MDLYKLEYHFAHVLCYLLKKCRKRRNQNMESQCCLNLLGKQETLNTTVRIRLGKFLSFLPLIVPSHSKPHDIK